MNKQLLIRITIIAALLTQVSHAAEVFYLLSKQGVFDKNGIITSNFSYTDDYVYWLERKLEKNKF